MPSWHDIKSLSGIDEAECKGLPESRALIQSIIDSEVAAGIPYDKIVVGGFSQGAAMSVYTGYQCSGRLAGIVCMSGYLPFAGDFATVIHANNKKTPVLICHGDADQVVAFKAGVKVRDTLTAAEVPVTFQKYKSMGHSACEQEVRDVAAFLKKCLPA